MVICLAAVILIFLICMSIRYNGAYYDKKFVPLEYIKSFGLAIKLGFQRLTGQITKEEAEAVIESFDSIIYLGAFARLKITLMSFVAGGALAASGTIFQTIYRNPMASPNLIGATAGVSLGNVIVVLVYSAEAITHIYLRYAYCYSLTAICVGVTLLFGKLMGDKKENYSVMEMVMAGSIISQVMSVISQYIMYNLEDENLLVYEELMLGTDVDTDTVSLAIFFGVMAISLLPMLFMKYRMNAVGMSLTEARTLGINIAPMRLIGQICGALMVTCAMIHFGQAGMISMVIPYMVRQSIGADFKKVITYSILAGVR